MKNTRTLFRTTLAAAAVAAALPAAHVAQAQTLQSASCNRLLVMVDEVGDDNLRPDFVDARTVAMDDDANACSVYVARVAQVGTIGGDAERVNAQAAETETETETATETVQIEQQATIEGEVQVTLPDPEVDIEQSPAEIAVRSTQPEVTVDQAQPRITVRQAQPIIRVQMAQPTITVEQPAPEIIVTMPDPGVNVASAQPQVEVNIPEPRVTVRQGEPMLNVDLAADMGAERDPNLERVDNEDGSMVVSRAGMSSQELEPNIQYVDVEGEPQVTINKSSPEVEYISAEPMVEITQDGEPQIELIQSGEPKIMIQDDDSASMDAEDAPEMDPDATAQAAMAAPAESNEPARRADQRDPREAFAADPSDVAYDGSPTSRIRVADLDGFGVINGRGEDLGEVERVVRNGQDTYVIVEHGGWFFGLNDKEVAFPVENILVRGEQVVLRGMTEEQIAQMPDYDYANEVNLGGSDEVEVMVVQ